MGEKKLILPAITLLLIFLQASCASTLRPTYTHPIETSRTFYSTYDKVWATVVSQVSASYPLQVVDKSSGTVSTQMLSLGTGFGGAMALQQYANEPKIPLATFLGGARSRISINVSRINKHKILVRVAGYFEGLDTNVMRRWYVWPSKGILEEQLLQRIANSIPLEETTPVRERGIPTNEEKNEPLKKAFQQSSKEMNSQTQQGTTYDSTRRLEQLKLMRQKELITEEEYQKKKKEILDNL